MTIFFNVPPIVGPELEYIRRAIEGRKLCGDGAFTESCHKLLSERVGGAAARLTHSCTAALEMATILANIQSGDEVVMPSYTFVSTANAVALRGGVPVFVDIREDTLNIDEALVESAITDRTRAIMAVHYAGVCAEMDVLSTIARHKRLVLIEDAAQAYGAAYRGRPAGSLSDLACFSFHETKNIVSGEGGALIIGDPALEERADIVREKGTNRREFHAGAVDKYTWIDIGSSYLPGEIMAAMLLAQLQAADDLNAHRLEIWNRYHRAFADLERFELVRRPIVPSHCAHNGHLYYLLLPTAKDRDRLIAALADEDIIAPFHYVPLHLSPAGQKYGRAHGALPHTEELSARLLRLPNHAALSKSDQERVIEVIERVVRRL